MSKYILVIFSVVLVTACSNSPELQVEEEIDCWGPQVPFFSQRGSAWSGDPMGSSSRTIGDSGCLITSITMALNYYGLYVTPRDLA